MSKDESDKDDADKGLRNLVGRGADLTAEAAGAITGTGLGLILGGPEGAIAGAASGPFAATAIKRVGRDLSERFLSPREQVRVGGAIAIAAAQIKERIDQGEQIRSDGFFDQRTTERSDAEEVIEGVLLAAQREPEEKKVPYLATLMSNISFDAGVTAHMAHQLVKAAEDLTYRQYCILRIAGLRGHVELRKRDYQQVAEYAQIGGGFPRELVQVLYECYDLYNRGFITYDTIALLGITNINPSMMKPEGIGSELYNLLGLAKIPSEDLEPTITQLRWDPLAERGRPVRP